MATNDSKIINTIHKYAQELISDAKSIGIGNNTFPIDPQRTEKLLLDNYIQVKKDNSDTIDQMKQYYKDLFSEIIQFINNIEKEKKFFKDAYISAVRGFIVSLWYDTIAQFKFKEFKSEFAQFQRTMPMRFKYYADLLPIIKSSISTISFSWLNTAVNTDSAINRNNIKNEIYKIYSQGVKDSKNKKIAIDKIYSFLQLIRTIERFFDTKHYKQIQINLLVPDEYTELRKAIVEGLSSFALIDIDNCRRLFDDLKQAIFTKAIKNDIYKEYDESVFNDSNIIERINKPKILLDEKIIDKFNLHEIHRYLGNDLIAQLNQRVRDKEITSTEANDILNRLCRIPNMRRELLQLDITDEEAKKLEEIDKKIFLRARELALNLPSQLQTDKVLYNLKTLQDLNDAIINSNSELQKYRHSVITNRYQEIIVDKISDFTSEITDSSFNSIKNIIQNRKLDTFFELQGSDYTILNTLTTLINGFNNKRQSRKANTARLFNKNRFETLIKNIQNMIEDLCGLQSNAEIIAANVDKYKNLHGGRVANYLTGYRTIIGNFFEEVLNACSGETVTGINNAIL